MKKNIKIICCILLVFSYIFFGCNKSKNNLNNASSILEYNGFEKLVDGNKTDEPFSDNLKAILADNDFELSNFKNLKDSDIEINNTNAIIQENNENLSSDYYIETSQGRYIHESLIKKEVEIRLNKKLEEIEESNQILLNKKLEEMKKSNDDTLKQELLNAKNDFERNERKQIVASVFKQMNLKVRIVKLLMIILLFLLLVFIIIFIILRKERIKLYEFTFYDELSNGRCTIEDLRKEILNSKDKSYKIRALNNIEIQTEIKEYKEKISAYGKRISDLNKVIELQFQKINNCNGEAGINQISDSLNSKMREVFRICYNVYLSIKNVTFIKIRQEGIKFLSLQARECLSFAKQIENKIDKNQNFEMLRSVSADYKSNADEIKEYVDELELKN